MAFSLADHLLSTQQTTLNNLLTGQDKHAQKQAILLVLAQFVQRDQVDTDASYQAIKTHNTSYFTSSIISLSAPVAEQIASMLINELNQLDDAASFGQDGISELLQGQQEDLYDEGTTHANDGDAALNSNITSLNKIMFDASKAKVPALEEQRTVAFYRIFKLSLLLFIVAAIILWVIR